MQTGFEFTAAQSKKMDDINDAPSQVPMRPTTEIRRNPDTDQKKGKRNTLRRSATVDQWGTLGDTFPQEDPVTAPTMEAAKEHIVDTASFNRREADLLAAMSKTNRSEELRRLAVDLEGVRAARTAAIQAARDIDVADMVIRDHLTPVLTARTRQAPTEADWLASDGPRTDRRLISTAMASEASAWFGRISSEVKADREELGEQASGMARHVASVYGPDADYAAGIFIDQVSHLAAHGIGAPKVKNPNPAGTGSVETYDSTEHDHYNNGAETWSDGHPPMGKGARRVTAGAFEQGQEAQRAGKPRIVPNEVWITTGIVGQNDTDSAEAWYRGWDAANVEDADEGGMTGVGIFTSADKPRKPSGFRQVECSSCGNKFTTPVFGGEAKESVCPGCTRKTSAYNPFSDPESAYNNPGKGPHKGSPDDLFPNGIPLHGDLTPEQQKWMDGWKPGHRGSVTAAQRTECNSCGKIGTSKDRCPSCGSTDLKNHSGGGEWKVGSAGDENWCYGHTGHRVFGEDGIYVVCDECGKKFDDPNNVGGLPMHEQPEEGKKSTAALDEGMWSGIEDAPLTVFAGRTPLRTSIFDKHAAENFDDGGYYLAPGAPLSEEFPTRCPQCSRPVQALSVFPGGLCIACHAAANTAMPTAQDVVESWGGTWHGASRRTAADYIADESGQGVSGLPQAADGPPDPKPFDKLQPSVDPMNAGKPEQEQKLPSAAGSRMAGKSLEDRAYAEGRRGYSSGRPADSPEDINGILGMGAPADQVDSLYYDHYVRGYNDAYHESLNFGNGIYVDGPKQSFSSLARTASDFNSGNYVRADTVGLERDLGYGDEDVNLVVSLDDGSFLGYTNGQLHGFNSDILVFRTEQAARAAGQAFMDELRNDPTLGDWKHSVTFSVQKKASKTAGSTCPSCGSGKYVKGVKDSDGSKVNYCSQCGHKKKAAVFGPSYANETHSPDYDQGYTDAQYHEWDSSYNGNIEYGMGFNAGTDDRPDKGLGGPSASGDGWAAYDDPDAFLNDFLSGKRHGSLAVDYGQDLGSFLAASSTGWCGKCFGVTNSTPEGRCSTCGNKKESSLHTAADYLADPSGQGVSGLPPVNEQTPDDRSTDEMWNPENPLATAAKVASDNGGWSNMETWRAAQILDNDMALYEASQGVSDPGDLMELVEDGLAAKGITTNQVNWAELAQSRTASRKTASDTDYNRIRRTVKAMGSMSAIYKALEGGDEDAKYVIQMMDYDSKGISNGHGVIALVQATLRGEPFAEMHDSTGTYHYVWSSKTAADEGNRRIPAGRWVTIQAPNMGSGGIRAVLLEDFVENAGYAPSYKYQPDTPFGNGGGFVEVPAREDDYRQWTVTEDRGGTMGPALKSYSSKTAETVADPSGGGVSSLPTVEEKTPDDEPMWPWEIREAALLRTAAEPIADDAGVGISQLDTPETNWDSQDPINGFDSEVTTGTGAADVAGVATPGGEAGYPQPGVGGTGGDTNTGWASAETEKQAAFQRRVQASLAMRRQAVYSDGTSDDDRIDRGWDNAGKLDPAGSYSIRVAPNGAVVYTHVYGTEAQEILDANPGYVAVPQQGAYL